MESEISRQLDYKKNLYAHPEYSLTKLLPQSGLQTFNLSNTGAPDTYFEIPTNVFNLSRSHLYFTLTPNTSGENKFNWIGCLGVQPIRQVTLTTRSNVELANINFANNYTNLIFCPETKLQEYLTYPKIGANQVGNNTLRRFFGAFNDIGGTARGNGSAMDVPYTEPAYYEAGTGDNDDPVLNIGLPLSVFKNSVFELDKDIYAGGQVLILRIVWENVSRYQTYGTSDTNPSSGAVTKTDNINLTNLALYLAVETNTLIANEVMAKVASPGGLQILIPYVHGFKNSPGAGTSQTITLRLNSGHGRKLKRIYHGVYNNSESGLVSFDHSNVNNAKFSEFYSMLNNKRLQQFNVKPATFDDYMILKEKLVNTVIQSPNMYAYNWFWLDSWDGKEITDEKSLSQNNSSGLDLSLEQKWDMYFVTMVNAAYNHYSFAITEKLLTIDNLGLTVA